MELQYLDKLKRNYIKNPLKSKEKPLKEDIVFLYIDCNLPLNELAKFFNVCQSTFANWLKFYNIKKPRNLLQQNVQKKCLEKYGTTTASKSDIVKEKAKQTCREKYGVDSYCQTEKFRQQSKETCLEKYGVEYASQNPEFQEKVRKTSLEKYGADHWLSTKRVKDQVKQTCLEKWGTTNVSTKHIDPEKLRLLNNKQSLLEIVERNNYDLKISAQELSVTYDGIKKKLQELDLWDKIPHNICYAENELKQLFPQLTKTRSVIAPQEIDLYDEKLKIGIEYNGVYWHCTKFKDKYYHQNKTNLAKQHNVFLYHIFENEWNDLRKHPIILSQLNNLFGKNQKIGARKCIIKEIDFNTCCKFLNENHLQGQDHSSIRIGLFYNNELISVMTFCKPRFNKNYEYELSRYCCKLNTSVIGGATKLFKYFLKTYNPKNIITYSDCAKTKGLLYPLLGFSFVRQTIPNYLWINHSIPQILTRYQCQKHNLKEFYNLGNTEFEIMTNRGFYQLFDCGNCVWEYKR